MKEFLQLFCLVIGCLSAVTGVCAETYRTRFEVNIEDEVGRRTISTPSDVVSGIPLTFEVGEGKGLSLLFSVEPPPSDEYSLTVSLLLLAKSTNELSIPLLMQTYHSRLVGGGIGPLEFEAEQDGLRIDGVVVLSSIH